jgi:hypothetical protein
MESDGSLTWRDGGAPACGEHKIRYCTSPKSETLCDLARNDCDDPFGS